MRVTSEDAAARYRDRLFRAALSVCRSPEDAEDAAQDALMRYHSSRREFESEEHLRAWLLRVTINRAKDISASFWRTHRETLEDYAETLTFAEPEDRSLFEAVMALPKQYRIAIHLYYGEGYSVREIGEILHRRENTVKSDLRRGRQLLKNRLQEEWQDE